MLKITKAVACALLVKKTQSKPPAKPEKGCNKKIGFCGANGECGTDGRCVCTIGNRGIKCEMTDAEMKTKQIESKKAMDKFDTESTAQDFSKDITPADMTKYIDALISLDPSSMEDADIKRAVGDIKKLFTKYKNAGVMTFD